MMQDPSPLNQFDLSLLVGHSIPAVFFLGFSSFALLLTLKRCRSQQPPRAERKRHLNHNLDHTEGDEYLFAIGTSGNTKDYEEIIEDNNNVFSSYCEHFVPEPNKTLLLSVGRVILVCTSIGMVIEASGALLMGAGILFQFTHLMQYLSFAMVGLVLVLEGHGRLPVDSYRMAIGLAFVFQYVLWYEHALIQHQETSTTTASTTITIKQYKEDDYDDDAMATTTMVMMMKQRAHILLADVNLVTAMTFGVAVARPQSFLAHISSHAMMFLNGLYLFSTGLMASNLVQPTQRGEMAGPLLIFESIVVVVVLIVGAAILGNTSSNNNKSSAVVRYGRIPFADPEEFEDNENTATNLSTRTTPPL